LAAMPTYASAMRADVACEPDNVWGVLAGVDERWGSSAGWARASGVDDGAVARLRASLVA
jgi:predicted transcriptional regulator with HTH domain